MKLTDKDTKKLEEINREFDRAIDLLLTSGILSEADIQKCLCNKDEKETLDIAEFMDLCNDHYVKIMDLFAAKNKQYAGQDDVLKAFKEGAERRYGEVNTKNMFAVLCDYKDKHDLALLRKGAGLADAKDRLYDVVVYCLLGLAILEHK